MNNGGVSRPRRAVNRSDLRARARRGNEDSNNAHRHQPSRCFSRTVSREEKNTYFKALSVWVLFTLAGWWTIPENLLPLFSHVIGFGFFLTITTRKTRWLGALIVGGLIFAILLVQAVPADWISLISNSAGYVGIATLFVLASLWRVAPDGVRQGISGYLYVCTGMYMYGDACGMTKLLLLVGVVGGHVW